MKRPVKTLVTLIAALLLSTGVAAVVQAPANASGATCWGYGCVGYDPGNKFPGCTDRVSGQLPGPGSHRQATTS
jgi:hypothetical protein